MSFENYSMEGEIVLFGAGWKALSLIDVYGKTSFTLWLCGCNLKCPFCHNYMLAECDKSLCGKVDVRGLLERLYLSRRFVDYFLVSGGEPLLQYSGLILLLKHIKADFGVNIAVNSNLTLAREVKRLLEDGLCDYILTDLKVPHAQLYGIPEEESEKMWRMYLESLKIVSGYKISVEVRVPVLRNVDLKKFEEEAIEAFNMLDGGCKYYVRVNPILGEPYTVPRDRMWSSKHCNPSVKDVMEVRNILIKLGLNDKIV